MSIDAAALVNMTEFARARVQLGANFARILGYFREDGEKSVAQIEAAMRAQNAAALVIPAHTLKGESSQFGAAPLAALAERIEMIGRSCVERHDTPSDALEHVVQLRPMFEATLELLERESNPLVARRPTFGKRSIG
ncbi:Hpt domain-containing protein [Stakelama tenebrarum]|uniref:Hpt domain-containing protein n=1 Tax=Stakelama tenebrarum TaxID=2711215 RepID=A0A6G6Y8G3_9SPHN|nr:Hpt domain-containing protein [Sphingosinithalassobacter tenebrarum]QIG81224.1 Hpt domain-containing protein [Sphingosinithalassobacter tenebrarum]